MITHLLDTDVCIHALKNRNRGLMRRFGLLDGHMAISDVTLFELYFGAEKYAEPSTRITAIEDFTSRLEILPFNSKAARIAGQIRARLEVEGKGIGAYDVLIAATARASGLILVTGNTREFSRVEGLVLESWA